MHPLNPDLYDALQRVFGRVRISSQGCPMHATYVTGRNGKQRLQPVSKGEYYVVQCAFCHDTGYHLYINHRWGVRDPVNGTRNLWLAHCFLCDALSSWENRVALADRLGEYAVRAGSGSLPIPVHHADRPRLSPVALPEDFQLLADLSSRHAARCYVRRRGFEPRELSAHWGVGFSQKGYRDYPGRLVIPLRAWLPHDDDDDVGDPAAERGSWQIVGYQGRCLGEPASGTPKYLTSAGTPKSLLLYGLEWVSPDENSAVVVVEGTTDAWSVGPGAVALLGKTISEAQCKLLRRMVPGRNIVVLLDADARAEATVVAERIEQTLARDLLGKSAPGRVVVAQLPDGRDPGACSTEKIARVVSQALAQPDRRRR